MNDNKNKFKKKDRQRNSSKTKFSQKTSILSISSKEMNKSTKSVRIKGNGKLTKNFGNKKKGDKNEEEKYIKEEIDTDTVSDKIFSSADFEYSKNLLSEKKVKNSLQRLISTSENLLETQNNILSEADKLIQNIEINEHEIDKIKKRNNNNDFSRNLNNYSDNLEIILSKLKQNSENYQITNKIKEENNNLKYKMQILSIDKSDNYRNIETELNSIKNVYSNEMNSMFTFFAELGLDNDLPYENISPKNINSNTIINFFTIIKKKMRYLKNCLTEKDEQNNNINLKSEIEDKMKNFNSLKLFEFNNMNNLNIIKNDKNVIDDEWKKKLEDKNFNSINSNRIKKIEDLCLQHNYEDDNFEKLNFQNNNTNNNNSNNDNNINNNKSDIPINNDNKYQISKSFLEHFQRNKNLEATKKDESNKNNT